MWYWRCGLTWYMAYFGIMRRLRSKLLLFMKTMATGQRERTVRTPMNGLIQMAGLVIPVYKRAENTFLLCSFNLPYNQIWTGAF